MVTRDVQRHLHFPSAESGEVHRARSTEVSTRRPFPSYIKLFAGIFILTVVFSVLSVFLLDRDMLHRSLFDLTNFTGPTTRSLLSGGGLSFCSDSRDFGDAPICFHAARMPVASITVAAGVLLFGDSFLHVSIFKIVLLLLPLEFAIFLVCRRLPPSPTRRIACALLLVAPFAMTIFIANVVNLQVEEDYAYSLLACAFALLLFGPFAFKDAGTQSPLGSASGQSHLGRSHLAYMIFFALIVDALFLSKSSMSPAVVVLTAAFFLQQRRAAARFLLLIMVAAAPIGWALYLHHVSGRYTLGTSLDGLNLHKGNGSIFLEHYPPQPLTSLDDYDPQLNRGLHPANEWIYNDYHLHAAIAYIRTHPLETLQGEWRKFRLLYVSLTKYGSSRSLGLRLLVEKSGLLLFRLIFWTAIGYSVLAFFSPPLRVLRVPAAIYLGLVAACALPYLIGFGYTRHASILIYPACLMWCRILCSDTSTEVIHARSALQ
jgi:hypothetical protein